MFIDRSSRVVGAIFQALIDLPKPSPDEEEPSAVHLDLKTTAACAGLGDDEIAKALSAQDDDVLSAVAGRPIMRLVAMPTGIAY
jgi:hypothetical protein